ncbi:hypothetical protein ACJX0J_016569, partial [Zea mays]
MRSEMTHAKEQDIDICTSICTNPLTHAETTLRARGGLIIDATFLKSKEATKHGQLELDLRGVETREEDDREKNEICLFITYGGAEVTFESTEEYGQHQTKHR